MLGFTSLDQDFEIDGLLYRGATGFDPTAAQASEGLDTLDSQTLKGLLDPSGFSKAELEAGLWSHATVRRFVVDYTNLPSSLSLDPPKHREFPRGYLGEFTQNSLGFEAKLVSELSKLNNNAGTTTSKTCRAHLGDDVCTKDITNFIHNLNVTAVTNRRIFTIDGGLPDNHLGKGRLKFTTGQNQNVHLDIAFHTMDQIILFQQAPFTIQSGDQCIAIAGCQKTKKACITKFQNFYYFDGEPDIPTTDLAITSP